MARKCTKERTKTYRRNVVLKDSFPEGPGATRRVHGTAADRVTARIAAIQKGAEKFHLARGTRKEPRHEGVASPETAISRRKCEWPTLDPQGLARQIGRLTDTNSCVYVFRRDRVNW
jgi:hypothetical protein